MKHTLTHLLELDISLVVLFEYDVMAYLLPMVMALSFFDDLERLK